jgi:cyclopropane fatty-acyl-phospholipid synthase-like methyltransferase
VKRYAPATQRNREPILAVLREVLQGGRVLEIASGTGEHAVFFARALPACIWQPTDVDDSALASISAHRADDGPANLLAPERLDVRDGDWGTAARTLEAIVCINMIHIAPWQVCECLFEGASRCLPASAPLVTYGPYRFHGEFTAPSNAAFDARLRGEDPQWGVRDVDDIERLAQRTGFSRERTVSMPANNHTLVFRKQ